jgi:hypothetical protein
MPCIRGKGSIRFIVSWDQYNDPENYKRLSNTSFAELLELIDTLDDGGNIIPKETAH